MELALSKKISEKQSPAVAEIKMYVTRNIQVGVNQY